MNKYIYDIEQREIYEIYRNKRNTEYEIYRNKTRGYKYAITEQKQIIK